MESKNTQSEGMDILEQVVKDAWNAGWISSQLGKGTPNIYLIMHKKDHQDALATLLKCGPGILR